MDEARIKRIIDRERRARKEAERLLEEKSTELWETNQNLERLVLERTEKLSNALEASKEAVKIKNDFISNMSHEIRTPLNAIIGFVDMMLRKEYQSDTFDNYLSIVHKSSQNLLMILNDILDLSKLQSGTFSISPKEVNLKGKLEQTARLFAKRAEEKALFYETIFSDDFPSSLCVDDTRIVQVVTNFISNAMKFTPEKGSIHVHVSYDNDSEALKVIVSDTGIGIEPLAQEKIFKSFEQEDASVTREYGGTGLGLTISKQLIELMDGHLIFQSNKNQGSIFGFEIPVKRCNTIDTQSETEHTEEEQTQNYIGRVLIAEDNETNVILLTILLDELGVSYDVVYNGETAVEAVKVGEYALVLMDNQMPKLSGIEATKIIREFDHTTPIVALSANAFKSEQREFIEAGMNDTLAKPIEYEVLKKILGTYLS